jgi:predicted ATPase
LAYEGYGITQLVSILLQIETAIISAQGEKTLNYYGLSALDGYRTNVFHFEENTIAIEEPEIHLHPSYQSKLAEMFAEAYKLYNIHFIIETHSEYLIRKFQTFVARKEVEADKISLNYVYSPEDYVSPSDSRVKHISINEDGSLSDSFGTGFYDEADNLSVELMSLKMRES